MVQRLVFHIGLAKTGTTSFQHFCSRNRKLLQQKGVAYPRTAAGLARNHSPLVQSYLANRERDFTIALRSLPRELIVRKLVAELDASNVAMGLVSSEHFAMHFDRAEARQLAADFARYDCKVVITLRDTHAAFLSSYNTHVTAGGCLMMDDYARSVLAPGTRFMRAREVAQIWADAFGAENIRLIDYDAEPDVTAAVLRQCGIEDALPRTDQERRRPSLDPKVIEALRDANQAIIGRHVTPDRNAVAWLRRTLVSILWRHCLMRRFRGKGQSRWAVNAAIMAQLDEEAALDRRWFADHYGLVLRGAATRQRIAACDNLPVQAAEAPLADAPQTMEWLDH